jgi:hypothetical protein
MTDVVRPTDESSVPGPEVDATPRTGDSETTETSREENQTRRRLLRLGAVGAAAAAGGAVANVLRAPPAAQAADGSFVVLGENNTAALTTRISGAPFTTIDSNSLYATGGTNLTGVGVQGVSFTSAPGVLGLGEFGTYGIGAYGAVGEGSYGVAALGSLAPLYLVPSSSSGPPTTGTHSRGEVYVDTNGTFFICNADGTPGTWRRLSPLVPVSPPARAYDSRSGGGPLTSGGNRSVPLSPGNVPDGATAALVNLTVVNTVGAGFLTLYEEGTPTPSPLTSNINWYANNQIIANNATPAISSTTGVTVLAGGQSGAKTDFILDVFAYYP